MSKWYISGKITGSPANNVVEKFARAEEQVKAFGHEPISPLNNGLGMEEDWNEHILADIKLLLECDAIYLLKDWQDSKGARIECFVAQECGLEIINQPDYAK